MIRTSAASSLAVFSESFLDASASMAFLSILSASFTAFFALSSHRPLSSLLAFNRVVRSLISSAVCDSMSSFSCFARATTVLICIDSSSARATLFFNDLFSCIVKFACFLVSSKSSITFLSESLTLVNSFSLSIPLFSISFLSPSIIVYRCCSTRNCLLKSSSCLERRDKSEDKDVTRPFKE